jgi:hypothetical protein
MILYIVEGDYKNPLLEKVVQKLRGINKKVLNYFLMILGPPFPEVFCSTFSKSGKKWKKNET